MSLVFTVTGVLETQDAARAFRALLAGSGIAHERIRLDLNPAAPHLPVRSSRQSGARLRRTGRSLSTHAACAVSVDVRSHRDRERIEELMAAAGAR